MLLKTLLSRFVMIQILDEWAYIEMEEIRVLPNDQPLEPFVKVNSTEVFCRRVLGVNIWL